MSKRYKNSQDGVPPSEGNSPAPAGGGWDRRQMLAYAAGSGMLLAAGGIALNNRQKAVPEGKPAAAEEPVNTTPVTQADITREYGALYDVLAKAKAKADSERKPLVVLAAELHNSRNSLMLEYMITDIAARLGVRNVVEEYDEKTVAKMHEQSDIFLKKRDMRAAPMLRGMTDAKLADFAKRSYLIASLRDIPSVPIYTMKNWENLTNPQLSVLASKDLNMKIHAIDPRHDEREKEVASNPDQDAPYHEKFERPMLQEIQRVAQSGSVVGSMGLGHVPQMVEWLNEGGAVAVGIDCTAGVKLPLEGLPPVMRRRFEAVKELYSPNIRTMAQPSPAEGLALVLSASVAHQLAQKELTQDEADQRQKLIDAVRPKVGMGGR